MRDRDHPIPATARLEVRDLRVEFKVGHGRPPHVVLDGVNLALGAAEMVGIIGQTGSGKTTLVRTILGLIAPASGSVLLDSRDIVTMSGRARRAFRRSGAIQLVHQDPLRSLDPALTVERSVSEALAITRQGNAAHRRSEAIKALSVVGLDASLIDRVPGEISGGQRQRVALARALITNPRVLLCDEPVSALDASNRGFVLKMLGRLRDELGLAMMIISHDLHSMVGVVDRVLILYEGRVVEEGRVAHVFSSPQHEYTKMLVAAAPRALRERSAALARSEQATGAS